jgi:polysaccharide biosynthesis/export protein
MKSPRVHRSTAGALARVARLFTSFALTMLLVATAYAQSERAPPERQHEGAVPAAARGAAPAVSPRGVGPDYVIGPGDTIQVFVWRNPELSVTVPVRPDGKVSSPLVEDMIAVGKTPSQLARDIEVRLGEYVRSPQVNVIVTIPQSSLSKITVVGQVRTPGPVAYRDGMTVLDVVLAVGGLAEFAAGNRAKLVRTGADGKPQELRVRLDDLVKKGKLKENMEVRPNDVLIVPESLF